MGGINRRCSVAGLRRAVADALRHEGLKVWEGLLIDATRGEPAPLADRGGHAHDLAHHAARAHHADGAVRDVCDADVTPDHEEIVHVAGVEAAVGDGIGRPDGRVDGDGFEGAIRKVAGILRVGRVEIDAPTGATAGIGEGPTGEDVVRGQHHVAHEAAGFPLAHHVSDPAQTAAFEVGPVR